MLTEEHVGWEKVLQGWKWFTDDKSSEPFWDITNASSRSCLKALVLLLLIWMRKVKWSAVCPQRIFSFKIKKKYFLSLFFFLFFFFASGEEREEDSPAAHGKDPHRSRFFSKDLWPMERRARGECEERSSREELWWTGHSPHSPNHSGVLQYPELLPVNETFLNHGVNWALHSRMKRKC